MVYQSTFHHGDKIPEKMGLKGRKDYLGSQFQRFRSVFTQFVLWMWLTIQRFGSVAQARKTQN